MKKLIIVLFILLHTTILHAACEILIVAVEKPGLTERGNPWVIKDSPIVWGAKEVPPNWIILKISDATKEQVVQYLSSWQKKFDYDILVENAQGYRIRVRRDESDISVSGENRAIKTEIKSYIVNTYGASIVSFNANEVIVDIPKPVDLQELKRDIKDKFSEIYKYRHYYFTDTDVDFALSNGGIIELTKAQVLSRIKSKLAE